MPRLRARAKRNSARADGEVAASSVHHVGQAASIACLLSPASRSPRRSSSVLRLSIVTTELADQGSSDMGKLAPEHASPVAKAPSKPIARSSQQCRLVGLVKRRPEGTLPDPGNEFLPLAGRRLCSLVADSGKSLAAQDNRVAKPHP